MNEKQMSSYAFAAIVSVDAIEYFAEIDGLESQQYMEGGHNVRVFRSAVERDGGRFLSLDIAHAIQDGRSEVR